MESKAARRIADELQDMVQSVSKPSEQATITAAVRLLRQFADTTAEDPAPVERLTIAAADERLKAPYGDRSQGTFKIRNASDRRCHVLYGPHVALPSGSYRFELSFSSVCEGPEPVIVDLCHRQGNRELYSRPCFPWELDNGTIRISCTFDQSVEDLEFRLNASSGFSANVTGLSITRRP